MLLFDRVMLDIDEAFTELVQKRLDAFVVPDDAGLFGRQAQILTLAVRHSVPAMYFSRDWTAAGGLMSYGPPAIEQGRQAGRIHHQSRNRPRDREVPPTLLSIADEVIE